MSGSDVTTGGGQIPAFTSAEAGGGGGGSGGGLIGFVGVAGSAVSNNANHSAVTLPASVTDGDLLLGVLGHMKGSQTTWTQPSGWPSSADVSVSAGGNSSDMGALVNHRVAASDGGVTYTWSNTPWAGQDLAVLDYAGVDPTSPLDGVPTTATDSVTAPSLTTATVGDELVYVLVVSGQTNTVSAAPAGFTQRFEATTTNGTSDPHLYIFGATQTSAGPTGPIGATISGTASGAVAMLLALRPAAATTTVTTSFGYDAAGQLVSQSPSNGPATAYTYDNLGRRATSTTAGVVTTYRYDDAGELCWTAAGSTINSNSCANPPAGATTYAYDPAGRMLSSSGSATTTSYDYDPAGRLQTLHLVAGTYDSTQTRTYSPDGDLIASDNQGSAARSDSYSWDDAAGVPTLIEATPTGGATADLTYGGGGPVDLAVGGVLSGIGLDAFGNVIPTTATAGLAAGAGYDAWGTPADATGAPTGPSLAPVLGYRGQLQFGDSVDLRARNYDTTLGAFTTVDPLDGVNGGTTIAALYPYADNNPIAMTDPTGEQATDYNAFIWPDQPQDGVENPASFMSYWSRVELGLQSFEKGVAFEGEMLAKMGLPGNSMKMYSDNNAIPDALNSVEDQSFYGITNQIIEIKSTPYLDLNPATRDGAQAVTYAEQAEAWLGEVDWIVPEGADFNHAAFSRLTSDYPAARLRIWMDNPGESSFINLASSDSSITPGDFYVYSETKGFRLKSVVDAEEARIEELEEEGYSPGQAEMAVDGGPLDAGDGGGDGTAGAAP